MSRPTQASNLRKLEHEHRAKETIGIIAALQGKKLFSSPYPKETLVVASGASRCNSHHIATTSPLGAADLRISLPISAIPLQP